MNPVIELLARLKARGVQLWLEDGELRFRAREGAFDAAARAEVLALKEDLKAFLARAVPPATGTIPRAAPADAYPLSYAQQRLWFLDRYEQFREVYHCPAAIPLRGPLDPGRLERALARLVERHASLRTVYALAGAEPEQRVLPAGAVTLPFRDFSAAADPVAAAEARAAELVRLPFDLETGPPWRAELLGLGGEEYCLVWVIHHIATDGWSTGVLARELAELCDALARDRAPDLPRLPIEYVDYAVWQRDDIERRVVPEQQPYWLEKLDGAPPETTLPTDFPRPPVRDGRGSVYRARLPAHLTGLVESAARRHQATPFMLLLAAFKVLVMRCGGQEDLVIGTPVANRPEPELAGLVGYFVNTLAIRTRPRRAAAFADYLREVRTACVEAYAHQELPFELLVARLSRARDLSRTPLFQIMFSLQNAAEGLVAAAGPVSPRQDIAKFDLNIGLTLYEGAYSVECEYATALFEAGTIVRLFERYAVLLEALAADTGRGLADYPLLSPKDLEQLARFTRGPCESLAAAAPVQTLFERRAERTPDLPALRFRGGTWSYGDLDRRVAATARRLREAGLRCGDIAALCLERSPEMVVSLLAVLRCGAAYLPIDPAFPPERAAFIVADAGARFAIVAPDTAELLEQGEAPLLEWGDGLRLDEEPGEPPDPVDIPLDALAYVIYTSGTTGQPKGVANHHLGLYNRLAWMQANHPIGPGDRVLQKTSYAFDVSVWEFLWPLMTGALLVVEEPGGHRDPRHLARTIEAEGVTVCHFVPSMLAQFLDGAPPEPLGSLRAVFASGEALPVETARRFLALGLDARLYNLYGPTEAAIDVSVWDCALPSAREGVLPIGRPIANLALHILDPDLQAVPVGVPGELHIGGVGLAAGYLGRPGLTADRFIPDPGGTPGARLYKTGDLARWLPDGSIEFLGRLDFQVKLRGLRIEIGEIEHHLAGLPGVGQCAVVVQKTPAGSDLLVAFIQPQGDPPPAEFLRRELKSFLPEYMIPARFEAIDGMPLNANGKLDRKRLAARPLSLAAESVDFATADATERTIQAIWRDVLQLERVGVEQNFFELGGNSLLMVQVHQALGAELGREVPLVKLFAHPTVRGLARYLDEPDDRTEQQERDIESTRQGRARLQRMRASRAKLEA